MKYLQSFKIFERKGNYQLFHKTDNLIEILESGYIIAGGKKSDIFWDIQLRKNVISNWEEGKFLSISATRNLDYMYLPALELDVEKISDKYKIIPYIENLDYYLDFDDNKLEPNINKNLGKIQNKLRSKSKNSGEEYWKIKTKKNIFDFGIAEEIIITNKLDVSKYVKRIILEKSRSGNRTVIDIVNKKYPHIEIIEIDNSKGYVNIKKEIKQKIKSKEDRKSVV
jgi:hypothetical protein